MNLTLINISLESLDVVEFLSGKDPEAQQASNVVDTVEARHFGGRCWRESHTESLEFGCAFILFRSSYVICSMYKNIYPEKGPNRCTTTWHMRGKRRVKGDSVPKSSMWGVQTRKAELKSLCLDPGQIQGLATIGFTSQNEWWLWSSPVKKVADRYFALGFYFPIFLGWFTNQTKKHSIL